MTINSGKSAICDFISALNQFAEKLVIIFFLKPSVSLIHFFFDAKRESSDKKRACTQIQSGQHSLETR